MKRVELSKNIYALIDDEDYFLVSQHKWHAVRMGRRWYAATGPDKKTNNKTLSMHRFIMNAQLGQEVDHKEHYEDYIDNRRSNLRLCTHLENQGNQRKCCRRTSSQYKGVSWHEYVKKWQTQIQVNKKRIWFGYFTDEIEAARVYNMVAKQYFGEFAKLNEV